MTKIAEDKLPEICQTLDNLVQNKNARIYASGMHALDESLVFGTADAYLRFASELVKFVAAAQNNEVESREIEGIKIQTGGSIHNAFDWCSKIVFDNSDLVSTEADARKLFEYWWSLQQETISTRHMADYAGENFQDCDFTDVDLINCRVKGMKINGILLEDLLDNYARTKK